MRNLIVQLYDDDNYNNLLTKLDFMKEYFDGKEEFAFSFTKEVLFTRCFWYDVPEKILERALPIIEAEEYEYELLPVEIGNTEFDSCLTTI